MGDTRYQLKVLLVWGDINKGCLRFKTESGGATDQKGHEMLISGLPERPTGQTNPLKQYSMGKRV